MTAEIAIINRSSVTLAADSAMTISVGGARKVYLTDKIFELSEKDPIGVMIYNNLEFMGAPLEVLIKQFRTHGCKKISKLEVSCDDFFDYLTSQWMPSEKIQQEHVKSILSLEYKKIFKRFEREMRSSYTNPGKRKTIDPVGILFKWANASIEQSESMPISSCFHDVSEQDVLDSYGSIIDEVIARELHDPPHNDGLRRVGVLFLHRDIYSEISTGFVFAGYGHEETFPSLKAFQTDGVILGRLKKKQTDNVATGRDEISAKVLPFAQRDVVDRFLVGIDPDLEDWIKKYLETLGSRTKAELFNGVGRLGDASKKKIIANLAATLSDPVTEFSEKLGEIKKAYSQETEDMVLFMAKQEAAHLAESLVNITSLKRKYSPDEESVSGPIDVAVISRSDGFVWVKRKHYFPSELNRRYFVRKFGQAASAEGDENAA